MKSLLEAILLRFAGGDAFEPNAQAQPPEIRRGQTAGTVDANGGLLP